jgi:fumarylacetoacetase
MEGSAQRAALETCLVPQSAIELTVPCTIGDYTDFYTGIHHATAVGRLFRPDHPLLPNYQWVPIGYHGRSSSIVASGTQVRRPLGQLRAADAERPTFGPTQRLDYEVELGFLVGQANALGAPVPIGAAEDHLFGVTLFNDWSARDIQAWEYQPLGPFLSKNFASTISPWVVTMEALAPFRGAWSRPEGDPQPFPYLDSPAVRSEGALDIRLEVLLETAAMRARGAAPQRLSATSYRHAYWTTEQLVAHHTVNGCALEPGDLLGTGTLSGPSPTEAGSLVELTGGGKNAIEVGGEKRTFLEDGDRVIFRGWCEKEGAASIGFGEVFATVLPAG